MHGALASLAAGLPIVPVPVCSAGPLSGVCGVAGGIGSSIAGAGAAAVLQAVSAWVVQTAGWLLGQLGGVMSTTTSVNVRASWFTSHYEVMAGVAGVAVLPLLVAGVIQAIFRQSAATLVRSAFVNLPLAMLLTGVAVQLVQLGLATTDALCATVSAGSAADVSRALASVSNALTAEASAGDGTPAFAVLLAALLVVFAALVLWLELLVRAAAVYVAVLFLPLALASIVWPAVSHWCRRLVDTLVAVVLSKFVIVSILALAAGALASGSNGGSFASVLAGAALLLLASFTPFTLLRLVPMIEAGAVHQLEGARHRVQGAVAGAPRSAALHALNRLAESPLPPAVPGSAAGGVLEPPGGDPSAGQVPEAPTVAAGRQVGGPPAAETVPLEGIPRWRGVPVSADAAAAGGAVAAPGAGRPLGPPPIMDGPPAPRAPIMAARSSLEVEAVGTPEAASEASAAAGPTATPGRGTHVVAHDGLGPVVRWLPASRAPVEVEGDIPPARP